MKNEKEILQKVRELIPKVRICLKNPINSIDYVEHIEAIQALNLLGEIEALMGYKEDQIQEGTKSKNLKLFNGQ